MTLVGIYMISFIACFGEFQTWRQAESYPLWLAKPLAVSSYPPRMNDRLFDLVDKVCGPERGMIAITKKANGYFVRCDDALSTTAWWHGVYQLVPESTK